MITAKWTSLDEALQNVMALGKELSEEEVLVPALLRIGAPLRDELERTAPRSSVAPHVAETFVVKRSKEEQGFGRVTVLVGPKPGYPGFIAPFLEFGTSKMDDRSWIRPAYDVFKHDYPMMLAGHLRAQYDRIIRKYTKRGAA